MFAPPPTLGSGAQEGDTLTHKYEKLKYGA